MGFRQKMQWIKYQWLKQAGRNLRIKKRTSELQTVETLVLSETSGHIIVQRKIKWKSKFKCEILHSSIGSLFLKYSDPRESEAWAVSPGAFAIHQLMMENEGLRKVLQRPQLSSYQCPHSQVPSCVQSLSPGNVIAGWLCFPSWAPCTV